MKRIILLSTCFAAIAGLAGLPAFAREHGDGPRHPMGGMSFEQLDADGDGTITRTELENLAQRRFEAADTDGNGSLSAAELEARAVARARDRSARMIERLDRNGDGEIALDEMPRRDKRGRGFGRMDKDGDGGVSRAEFEAARARMQERHGRHGGDKG